MPFAFSLGAEKKGIAFWPFQSGARSQRPGAFDLCAALRSQAVAIPARMLINFP
jgi:hypothetical protein